MNVEGPFSGLLHPGQEAASTVKTIYFRAYDETGGKRSGTMEATDVRAAATELREGGLRPYFLHDYHALKEKLRRKKKRRRIIAISGSVAVALSLLFSGLIVGYAGRERAPDIGEYEQMGLVEGAPGVVVARTKEERLFGLDIYEVWQRFSNKSVTGLEVSKFLMTVYVNKGIRHLSDKELESLAESTVRASQRHFRSSGCTLLVVENGGTILEIQYNGFTKSTTLKSYR